MNILIVGKIPPPYGGVTVHVKRLVRLLNKNNIRYIHVENYRHFRPRHLVRSTHIHIHQNDPFKRMALIFLGKIFGLKVVVTYHRDFNRTQGLKRALDVLSARLSNKFLVLNESSFSFFKKHSSRVVKTSSFISPYEEEYESDLDQNDQLTLHEKIKDYQLVLCSCAHHLRFFKDRDIYGFVDIIEAARKLKNYFFILSDPSAEYYAYIASKNIEIPANVYFITYQHKFLPIIMLSDIYIRNTNTDGDSLSIHEALHLGKSVIATNCVSRPENVILYNIGELLSLLRNMDKEHRKTFKYDMFNGRKYIERIYEN